MRYVPLIDTNYNLFAKLTLEHEYSIKEHEGETFWVINEQIFKILYFDPRILIKLTSISQFNIYAFKSKCHISKYGCHSTNYS